MDSVLAELTDEVAGAVNKRADRQGLSRGRLSPQVIEYPCDLAFFAQPGGHRNSGYTQESAVRLVREASKFIDGWLVVGDGEGQALLLLL